MKKSEHSIFLTSVGILCIQRCRFVIQYSAWGMVLLMNFEAKTTKCQYLLMNGRCTWEKTTEHWKNYFLPYSMVSFADGILSLILFWETSVMIQIIKPLKIKLETKTVTTKGSYLSLKNLLLWRILISTKQNWKLKTDDMKWNELRKL